MKLIIPMAGIGKRMRPHTLTVPKPLLPVAGKPIVQTLAEDISAVCPEKIEEIAFITGNFGEATEQQLLEIAAQNGAEGKIYHQHEALGTAHAVLCAAPSLQGKTIVAFADTLFHADFKLDVNKEGIIWVHRVDDPSSFGVVKTHQEVITDFYEKPKNDVGTDKAIIGIYYFREGQHLREELQYLTDNKITGNGEYQITDALENMMKKGVAFHTEKVTEWLDCGNKDATVNTNQRMLDIKNMGAKVPGSSQITESKIIPPCFIGDHVVIENATIGPYVSVGNGTSIKNATIQNSVIQNNCVLRNVTFADSMLGNHVTYLGGHSNLSIGDYSMLS